MAAVLREKKIISYDVSQYKNPGEIRPCTLPTIPSDNISSWHTTIIRKPVSASL
jgi:hypothetical protein